MKSRGPEVVAWGLSSFLSQYSVSFCKCSWSTVLGLAPGPAATLLKPLALCFLGLRATLKDSRGSISPQADRVLLAGRSGAFSDHGFESIAAARLVSSLCSGLFLHSLYSLFVLTCSSSIKAFTVGTGKLLGRGVWDPEGRSLLVASLSLCASPSPWQQRAQGPTSR